MQPSLRTMSMPLQRTAHPETHKQVPLSQPSSNLLLTDVREYNFCHCAVINEVLKQLLALVSLLQRLLGETKQDL